jgi:leucyl-tRNA synthetase
MSRRYNPSEIEPKWQSVWDEQQTYRADLTSDKPKYFAMSMFNYPSGAGIHIGHAMNYTISDVMARFKRQSGYESYHPVGWDSFGLPAENFAIKTGISPQASMAKIIPSYHAQYKAMGWSNDWSREIATSDPRYYRWTQWIFEQVYKAGLAYQDARQQWWCTKCQTVLSNEQVIDGKCWRHDGADDPMVEKKEVKQWFFRITEFADKMLEATDDLDWTESVKLAQKNWIGKSQGAEIDFAVDGSDVTIPVFTTRPDTIFGATFLVLAPEHDAVHALAGSEQKSAVDEYVKQALKKTELERQSETKVKTGVFTGTFAVNPASGKKIPVWVADYVLGGYGTGAIMAVPAHDERDNEFAQAFGLPIIRVVESEADQGDTQDSSLRVGEGVLVNSDHFDGTQSSDAREEIVDWLKGRGIGKAKTTFKIRDWSVSRQRYWGAPIPIIHCQACGPQLVPEDQLPVVLPELSDFAPSGDGRSALARATEWLETSCPNCSGPAERETDTLDTYICSSWYFLRYLDPENIDAPFRKDVADKWMPVDFYNGADHATAHMIYARFITRFLANQGHLDNPEPFKKFLFNGKVTAQNGEMFSKSKGNGVDPLEIINQGYGADALRTYLMFAAPLDTWIKWDPQGVPATHRFLSRIWNLVQEFLAAERHSGTNEMVEKVIHPVARKVTHDIEHQKYNTAIAAMMEATNKLYGLKKDGVFAGSESWQSALVRLVALVAPFAPHMADELWQQLGKTGTVQRDSWPAWEEKYLSSDTVTVAVQVNGKLRSTLSLPSDVDEDSATKAAMEDPGVLRHLDGKEPRKVIYIAGRLINIVV